MGFRIKSKNFMGLATLRATFSDSDEAIFLGVTSPKIKIVKVRTTVEIMAPLAPNKSVKNMVATVVVAIFTILFPIKMVVKTLPILSVSFLTKEEFSTPFSSICLILNTFKDVRAVSDEERNALPNTPIMITISSIQFV